MSYDLINKSEDCHDFTSHIKVRVTLFTLNFMYCTGWTKLHMTFFVLVYVKRRTGSILRLYIVHFIPIVFKIYFCLLQLNKDSLSFSRLNYGNRFLVFTMSE